MREREGGKERDRGGREGGREGTGRVPSNMRTTQVEPSNVHSPFPIILKYL